MNVETSYYGVSVAGEPRLVLWHLDSGEPRLALRFVGAGTTLLSFIFPLLSSIFPLFRLQLVFLW